MPLKLTRRKKKSRTDVLADTSSSSGGEDDDELLRPAAAGTTNTTKDNRHRRYNSKKSQYGFSSDSSDDSYSLTTRKRDSKSARKATTARKRVTTKEKDDDDDDFVDLTHSSSVGTEIVKPWKRSRKNDSNDDDSSVDTVELLGSSSSARAIHHQKAAPAEDDDSSVDTAELTRSILARSNNGGTTAAVVSATDTAATTTSTTATKNGSASVQQQKTKPAARRSPEPHLDRSNGKFDDDDDKFSDLDADNNNDASSVDTDELARCIQSRHNPAAVPPPPAIKIVTTNATSTGQVVAAPALPQYDDFVLPEQSDSSSSEDDEENDTDSKPSAQDSSSLMPMPRVQTKVAVRNKPPPACSTIATARRNPYTSPSKSPLVNIESVPYGYYSQKQQQQQNQEPPSIPRQASAALVSAPALQQDTAASAKPLSKSFQQASAAVSAPTFQQPAVSSLSASAKQAPPSMRELQRLNDYELSEAAFFGNDNAAAPVAQNEVVDLCDDDDVAPVVTTTVVREGLRSAKKSPAFLQSSPQPLFQTTADQFEDIEYFSEDDDDEVFGFGRTASAAIERRKDNSGGRLQLGGQVKRPDYYCSEIQPNASFQDSNTNNGYGAERQRNEEPWPRSAPTGHATFDESTRAAAEIYRRNRNNVIRPEAAAPESFSSVTRQQSNTIPWGANRNGVDERPRRRIRDATASNPNFAAGVVRQTAGLGGAATNHSASSIPTDNWNANWMAARATGSAGTAPPRNDLVGGSGVGAGSYQMIGGGNRNNNNNNENEQPRYEQSNPLKKATRKRGGFKRKGRGRGRSRGRGGSSRSSGRGRGRANRSSTSTASSWAGNADDPNLQHVGGAEMSF